MSLGEGDHERSAALEDWVESSVGPHGPCRRGRDRLRGAGVVRHRGRGRECRGGWRNRRRRRRRGCADERDQDVGVVVEKILRRAGEGVHVVRGSDADVRRGADGRRVVGSPRGSVPGDGRGREGDARRGKLDSDVRAVAHGRDDWLIEGDGEVAALPGRERQLRWEGLDLAGDLWRRRRGWPGRWVERRRRKGRRTRRG